MGCKGVFITWTSLHDVPSSGLCAVVNNAAIKSFGDIELVSVEEMKTVAEVNFYGMVRVTKAFISMIRQSKGKQCSLFQSIVR